MRAVIPHVILLTMLLGLHVVCVQMAGTPNLYQHLDDASEPVEVSSLQ